MRGTIVGAHGVSLRGHLSVSVVDDLCHEAFMGEMVSPLARGGIGD
jgi:hypothetical protein